MPDSGALAAAMPDGLTDRPKLEARGVCFTAGGRPILNGIDLTLKAGERLAVIGPNGSGKSTLLRCLHAWCTPSDGAVLLDGKTVAGYAPLERAKAIAVLAQEAENGLGLTVREVVALGRLPHRSAWGAPSREDLEQVDLAVGRLGLESIRDRPYAVLSGGEKQRTLFARALAQQTQVLMLDEPTNHLDIRHQLELLDLAAQLGLTVIATLHDINLAARWGDRLCLMNDGAVEAIGPASAVLSPDLIAKVYGVEVDHDIDPRTGALRLSFYPRAAAGPR